MLPINLILKIVKLWNSTCVEFLNFNIDAKVEKWYNDNCKQEGAFLLTKDINKMDTKHNTRDVNPSRVFFCALLYRRKTPAIDAPALLSSAFFRSNPWALMASR